MKNKGWTKLYRGQFVHWISKKPWCDGYAWAYLYSQANHKSGIVNMRNEYIKVERGQFITSKKKLMEIFGWTRSHLNNFIKGLKIDKMITCRITHRYTVVTIMNYNIYQGEEPKNDTQTNTQTDIQTTYRRHTDDHKQECIKNDLRMIKKFSPDQIKKNKEGITKSKKLYFDIMNKK